MFVGAAAAMITVAGIGVIAGRALLRVLPERVLRKVAAGIFARPGDPRRRRRRPRLMPRRGSARPAPVVVGVVVVVVLRQQLGRLRLAVGAVVVGVAVLVDHHRRAVVAHEPAAERLGQQLGSEHVVGRPAGQQAAGEQHHDVGPLGLAEVVGRQHDRRAGGRLLVDDLQDALLADEVEAR